MCTTAGHDAPAAEGRLLHWARGYDLLSWLLLLGREREFRERLVRLARIERGQRVLDVGCGTGSLALAAKRAVGAKGEVHGVDASPAMVARARHKSSRAGLEATFHRAPIQALPFPDDRFDVALSTLMLHHLSPEAQRQGLREVRRVLAPGGRVLAVDFGDAAEGPRGLLGHIHRRHGGVALADLVALLREAELEVVESGAVGVLDLGYALATAR